MSRYLPLACRAPPIQDLFIVRPSCRALRVGTKSLGVPVLKEVLEGVADLSERAQKQEVRESPPSSVPPPTNNMETFLASLRCVMHPCMLLNACPKHSCLSLDAF